MNALSYSKKPEAEDATLTVSDAFRLIGICIELIDLCSRVSWKNDPGVESIFRYARDEVLTSALGIRS
jgi:hypothetical protein